MTDPGRFGFNCTPELYLLAKDVEDCINKCLECGDVLAIDFQLHPEKNQIYSFCSVKLTGKTGAEMEALTGVSVSLLTIYDMCKSLDKGMEISDIHLEEKSGGKSGHYIRKKAE